MKSKVSYIRIRFIIHDWDEEELIRDRIQEILNYIPEKLRNRVEISEIKGKGLISGVLKTIEIKSDNKKVIEYLLKYLFDEVNKEEIEKAMNFDDNYNIYIRLNKTDFIVKKKTTPRYEEDSVHIKISLDMPKKSRESVKKELFKTLNK